MILITLVIACCEYILIRGVLKHKWDIHLDLIPDRYGNDLKRTWLNASVFLACFYVTLIIMIMIFGLDLFDPSLS